MMFQPKLETNLLSLAFDSHDVSSVTAIDF